jgi:hypothetical protein
MAHLRAKDGVALSIILLAALAFKEKRRYTMLKRSPCSSIRQ